MDPNYSNYFKICENDLVRIGPEPNDEQRHALERKLLTDKRGGAYREIFFDVIEMFYDEAKLVGVDAMYSGLKSFDIAKERALIFCWKTFNWRQQGDGLFTIMPLSVYQVKVLQEMRMGVDILSKTEEDTDVDIAGMRNEISNVLRSEGGVPGVKRSATDEAVVLQAKRIKTLELRLDLLEHKTT